MTCPFEADKIQDYIEDRLSPEDRQAVASHLEACPECHREWVEMVNLMELLGGLPMAELPEGFREELHEKLTAVGQHPAPEKRGPGILQHLRAHVRPYGAAAAVLLIGMVTVGSLGGLLQRKDAPALEGYNMAAPAEAPAVMMDQAKLKTTAAQEEAGYDAAPASTEMAAARGYGADGGSVGFTASDADAGLQGRKVIRSGSANLSTLDYDKTLEALTAYAAQKGGYVENLYTGNQYMPVAEEKALRTGSITLRIPEGQFDGFFKELENYGRVTEESFTAEDISAQYRDTYNQAVNLEVREAKLREIMGTAQTVQDVMAVESELSRVRGEINQLKGTLQQWDALVSLSRITVSITEVRSLETQVTGLDATLATRLREAFVGSVNGVITGIEGLAVWIVAAVPWLLAGGVILAAVAVPARRKGWFRKRQGL